MIGDQKDVRLDNDAGVRLAFEQVKGGAMRRGQWEIAYDRRSDVFSLRQPGHGPSTSFFLPMRPEVFLRLDNETHELTGIDFTDFRRVLVPADALLESMWKAWLRVQRRRWIPFVRRGPQCSEVQTPEVVSRVGEELTRLCLTA